MVLKRISFFLVMAFLLYMWLSAPAASGEVVETVGQTAASGFESARDWVVDFMRDHEFMQGG
jgi:succinate dehydrogenase/fumarate reductase cytochrome b subunit